MDSARSFQAGRSVFNYKNDVRHTKHNGRRPREHKNCQCFKFRQIREKTQCFRCAAGLRSGLRCPSTENSYFRLSVSHPFYTHVGRSHFGIMNLDENSRVSQSNIHCWQKCTDLSSLIQITRKFRNAARVVKQFTSHKASYRHVTQVTHSHKTSATK